MHTNTFIEPPALTRAKLRLFTLYADFAAGIRARRLVNQTAKIIGSDWEFAAEMWKLDSVAPVGPIREMIAQEAGESDVLLIAISSPDQPDSDVAQWLHSLVNWKANRLIPGLLVGLLGDEEHKVTADTWVVGELAAFASRTQMDLAWRAVGRDFSDEAAWLTGGVEKLLIRKKACSPS